MIKVIELFSGIGAQRKALINLGIQHEVIGISEVDKFAIQSYNAIYGQTHNYGDIRTIKRLEYADLWTYSSPCQDISVAGRQRGLTQGTRSSLLYEVGRLLKIAKCENKLPKYLLLENVKNLVSKKFYNQFEDWVLFLDKMGYNTTWKVLNAKEYGTPQNRERVYAISIRKDLNQTFSFPETEVLKLKLSDLLDSDVDEKFYVPYDKIKNLITNLKEKEVSSAIRVAGRGTYDKKHNWDCVAVKEGTKKGYSEVEIGDSINISFQNSTTRRGRVGKQIAQTLTTSPNQVVFGGIVKNCGKKFVKTTDIALTLLARDYKGFGNQNSNCAVHQIGNFIETTRFGGNPQDGRVYHTEGISPTLSAKQGPCVLEDYRIRRLTPIECWRLMGFDDNSFYLAKNSGVSDTQLYKQAGNSIVVGVLERIFQILFSSIKD